MASSVGDSRVAILRVEAGRYQRSSLILAATFALLSAFYFSIFPGFADDAEQMVEAFPDFMFDFFGIDALHTIEGFIAAEIYSFFWVVLVAVYFAYLGAGMIAADIRTRRLDLLLANPISRESVLLQKLGALWLPFVVLNLTVPVIVFLGSVVIGETMNPVAILMLHLLSIPYLLVCAGLGLVISVLFDRPRRARALALGLILFLWLIEGLANMSQDYEFVGAITPSRYFDETAILVHEEYAVLDAMILVGVFLLLVGIAVFLFARRDI